MSLNISNKGRSGDAGSTDVIVTGAVDGTVMVCGLTSNNDIIRGICEVGTWQDGDVVFLKIV